MSQVEVSSAETYHLTRAEYVDSRKSFFDSAEPVTARKVSSTKGHLAGWALYRGEFPLFSSRGGLTVFKGLDSVSKFCAENGIDSFGTGGV